MRIIEEIILKVGVDTSDIDSKVGNASDDFKDLEDSVKDYDSAAKDSTSTSKGLGGAVTGMAAAAAAATVVLGVMIAKNIEMQTETLHMAQALGVGAQRLQDLQNVGRVFGATAEDVVQGIKNISESASEAFVDQSGSKFELFKELNIDLEEFNRLSPDEQFIRFSEALSETDTQGRKTAIQLAIMGEEGFKLSNTMEELARNSDEALEQLGKLGGDIDSKQVEEFSQEWNKLGIAIDGVTDSIVDSFIPIIQGPLEKAVEVLSRFSRLKTDFDFEGIAKEAQDAQNKLDALVDSSRGLAGSKEAKLAEEEERRRLVQHLADEDRRHEQGRRLREFAHKQEVKQEEEKNRKIEAERRKQVDRQERADKRVIDRKKREEQSAVNTIKAIGSARRRDRLSQLRERSESFGVGAVEAGSAEAARLAAERQLIDPDKRTQIEQLEAAIQEEELDIQREQLKTAKQILKKERNVTTIKTKRIN